MKMKGKCITALLAGALVLGTFSACSPAAMPKVKVYEENVFTTTAWWAPYEITEDSFNRYKNAGLNTMLFVNHSRESEIQDYDITRYFIGSDLTEKTLEMCRKTGLNAIISEGKEYNIRQSDTPFTDVDYSNYKDIIVGVHIEDEPSVQKMEELCIKTRIDNFKQAYSVPFIINLQPVYGVGVGTGTLNYQEYLKLYEECILKQFPDTPYISVDFYPYHNEYYSALDKQWISCYEQISQLAAKYKAETNYFIQTSEGNEFVDALTEEVIRYQVYVALCFGGTSFSYYCYSVPDNEAAYESGSVLNPMYISCMLDKDNQPSHLYDYVKQVNSEIQLFASAYRAYDFTKCMSVCIQTYGAENFKSELKAMNTLLDFTDRRYVSAMETEGNCLVGCFDREEDEAYMLVNYGYPGETDPIELTVTLKGGATHIAVYGGKDYEGIPEVFAAKDGKLTLTLAPGDGKFIVPLA